MMRDIAWGGLSAVIENRIEKRAVGDCKEGLEKLS